ncbi:hypothetical protein Dimus_013488, partial [Dionaea muscipula]
MSSTRVTIHCPRGVLEYWSSGIHHPRSGRALFIGRGGLLSDDGDDVVGRGSAGSRGQLASIPSFTQFEPYSGDGRFDFGSPVRVAGVREMSAALVPALGASAVAGYRKQISDFEDGKLDAPVLGVEMSPASSSSCPRSADVARVFASDAAGDAASVAASLVRTHSPSLLDEVLVDRLPGHVVDDGGGILGMGDGRLVSEEARASTVATEALRSQPTDGLRQPPSSPMVP